MDKKTAEKIIKILEEKDITYTRLIREYGILDKTPSIENKARKYVGIIKDLSYQEIEKVVIDEKENIVKLVKVNPGNRDTTQEIKRSSELLLMKSAIDGSSDNQLIELAKKYANSEYEEDFRIIVQPKIKALLDNKGPNRVKNEAIVETLFNTLEEIPEETKQEIESLDTILSDVNSMLYFNNNTLNIGAILNEEGRIIHGNFDTRNINFDLNNADETFNPLGLILDPLVISEKSGSKTFKTIKYQFDWED